MTNVQLFSGLWLISTLYCVALMLKLTRLEKLIKNKDLLVQIIVRKKETDNG